MPDTLERIAGTTVLMCAAGGPTLRGERDAMDLIAEAGQRDAGWVVIPAERVADEFFQLSNGIAGGILQKFVNYRMRLVILGDISRHTEASNALRDLVRESNRGRHAWFVAGLDDLRDRLTAPRP